MIILVCGSRHAHQAPWQEKYITVLDQYILGWRDEHPDYLLLHGGCKGVDVMAGAIASAYGTGVIEVKANWDHYGNRAGPIRNRWMLEVQPKLVVGFHHDWISAKGTTDMIKAADAKKIETLRVRVT